MITLETGAEAEIPETEAQTSSLETGIGVGTIEAGPGRKIIENILFGAALARKVF